jgi:hypothetical protein
MLLQIAFQKLFSIHGSLCMIFRRFGRTAIKNAKLFALASAAFVPSLSYLQAQAPATNKPFVTVAIAPLGKMLQDLSYVMRAAGAPEISGTATMMVNGYSSGIDRNRPAGLTVALDDTGTPVLVGYLPMTDREAFFEPLRTLGEVDDLGDGKFAMEIGAQTVFAREKGEWLYVAQEEGQLENVPENPLEAIGKQAERYDLSFRIAMENIPKELKQMLSEQMRSGYEEALAQQSAGQSEEEAAAAEAAGEQAMDQMTRMLDETDELLIGWGVDQKSKKTFFDIGTQFVDGSDLAKQIEAMKDLKSGFSGFQSTDNASSMRFTSAVAKEDLGQLTPTLDNALDMAFKRIDEIANGDSRGEDGKAFLRTVRDVLIATFEEGMIDGGYRLTLDDGPQLVAGARVADGNKVAQAVQTLYSKLQLPELPPIQFNASNYKGVTFHPGKMAVPSNQEELRKAFGAQIDFVVGTADKGIFLALGKDAEAQLKATIDANESPLSDVTPLDFHIEMVPLMGFLQTMQDNPMIASISSTLQQYSASDSLQVNTKVVPRGLVYRFTVEEGVLRAVGGAARSGMQPAGF